jgi:hypothetical protein
MQRSTRRPIVQRLCRANHLVRRNVLKCLHLRLALLDSLQAGAHQRFGGQRSRSNAAGGLDGGQVGRL